MFRIAAGVLAVALLVGCGDDADDTDADGDDGDVAVTTTTAAVPDSTGMGPASDQVLEIIGRIDCEALLSEAEAGEINGIAVDLVAATLAEINTVSCSYRTDPILKSFTVAVAPRTEAFDGNRDRQVSVVDGVGDEAYVGDGVRSRILFVRVGELGLAIDIREGEGADGAGTFSIERAMAVAELVVPRVRALG